MLLVLGVGAALLLRQAWRDRGPRRPWLIVGGWLLIAAGVVASGWLLGADRGPFAAFALIPFAALVLIAIGVQVRDPNKRAPREIALEPSERPSKAWRGWLRAALAGPIGGIAAMGVGLAWTVWVPGEPQTRMVIGGLLVPVLWGGAMAWTLADNKILRATAVLVGVTVVTFAASAIKGFA
ncbi:hypothetical protein CSW64_12565 [Caulobacter mirabilis]|uniref:Uncharacterized protein n=1 Tax=Caulobacter mirabilis TaxID=69666 RepID=A0A2D2B3Z0_9CAUL|nr:hypothetical protein CSW64_12565 [Caulobacter mirabilis]